MNSFFPTMTPAEEEPLTESPAKLPWPPISEVEVYRSLKSAKGSTAPGEEGLPMLVWKRLWRHLGNLITRIFAACIELGYQPQRWRSARIVVLRKPGKPDYSLPGAYRPISLLNTLGKLLEAVIARRLSHLAEHHGLLPDTQFGGRPGRTTEQALLILANAIDRAWYVQRVVTLVAFDLKGAFNGVNQTSLDARLQSKGIPAVARRWIANFMSGRQTNIKFDDYSSEVAPLHNAGLAQGSPLSPILFAFFNCDLVDQPVDFHGGASAFIDDYFRWRVGWSAEENLAKIQSEDINCRIELMPRVPLHSISGYIAQPQRRRMTLPCLPANIVALNCRHRRSLRFIHIQSINFYRQSSMNRPIAKITHTPDLGQCCILRPIPVLRLG